ncbi:uncharacterized protein LOC134835229 [Culicoides brevitarsis]|uniref:uncharacterized protein LOC134835229 n=1 Tax=Culicoides brevitarsis TaxID=469753 RepID=UPI00307C7825
MKRILIAIVMFCLVQFSGSLNAEGQVVRHTRAALMPLRSLEASRKDNKRYGRVLPDPISASFDKYFLGQSRLKRAAGTDGNHTINLSAHNISDITLSDFLKEITNPTLVTSLNLASNTLRQLNVSAVIALTMPHLSALDVSQNQLSAIDAAADLSKLTTLNVSHNSLYKFATTGQLNRTSSIEILDLSCNKFNASRNIALYNLNNLQQLDLSCNALTTIDRNLFFNLSQLHTLDVSCNRVSELRTNTFVYLTQLRVLKLSRNNISFIENETFSALPNLEYLDVSDNVLHADSVHALQGIPDLVALSLANNEELSESLQGFVATWSLKEIDGSGTGLCHIPAALTQSVRILKLVDNFLQVIRCGDLDSYPLLQHLILSSNQITDIEDDALGRLEIIETLYLNDNKLKRIPVSLPSSLIDLHLENNLITEIQPQVLTGLKTLALLNLSGNKIIYLPGLPLPRLSRLNMRSCELESVNQELVKMSPYLRDLYLEGNPIRCADLLGIAEWATPCRESTETEIATTTADDFFIHKWHSHASCGLQAPKKKITKVCKEIVLAKNTKNNKAAKKINGNNYFAGNEQRIAADNKLMAARQSSLSPEQAKNRAADKNVNDKFENIDKIDNNVNDQTLNGDDGKQTETKTNISSSFEKSSSNVIKTTTTEQTKEDNQIVAKKLISDTSTLSPGNNHNTDKDLANERRVQTNDVNQPIKQSKQKKVTKHWNKLSDRVINMSSSFSSKAATSKERLTKNKTKVMAITNDDDYLNDDNKAVVDNFVTVTSQITDEKTEKTLEAKQLSLHFNFTKIHKASSSLSPPSTITTTAKPYTERHNKINLDKHVQLNRKVNVLQQNSQLVTNYVQSEDEKPQQLTHNSDPNDEQNASPMPPQKQEWSPYSPSSSSSQEHFRKYLGHPGLFMVIGATIGMAAAFGFVHLYRCQKMRYWQHTQVEANCDNVSDISTINTPTHSCHHRQHRYDDLLPMDVLNHKSHVATTTTSLMAATSLTERPTPNSPIELW